MIDAEANEHLGEFRKRVLHLRYLALLSVEIGFVVLALTFALPGTDTDFNQGYADYVVIPLELDGLAAREKWRETSHQLMTRQWMPTALVVGLMIAWRIAPFIKRKICELFPPILRLHGPVIMGSMIVAIYFGIVSQIVTGISLIFIAPTYANHALDDYKAFYANNYVGTREERQASIQVCIADASQFAAQGSGMMSSQIDPVSHQHATRGDCEKKHSWWREITPTNYTPVRADAAWYVRAQNAYIQDSSDKATVHAALSHLTGAWRPDDPLHQARLNAMAGHVRDWPAGPLPSALDQMIGDYDGLRFSRLVRTVFIPAGFLPDRRRGRPVCDLSPALDNPGSSSVVRRRHARRQRSDGMRVSWPLLRFDHARSLAASLKQRRDARLALGSFLIFLGVSTMSNAPTRDTLPEPNVRGAIPYATQLLITPEFAANIDVTQGPFTKWDGFARCTPEIEPVDHLDQFQMSCLSLTKSKHRIETPVSQENRLASIDAHCRSLDREFERDYCASNTLAPAKENTIILKSPPDATMRNELAFLWAQSAVLQNDPFDWSWRCAD